MKVTIEDLSKKVANKLNIDSKTVEEVNRSQWHMLKDIMQGWTYEGVKIIYIGKFYKKPGRSQAQINYAIKRKQLNESNRGNL